MSDYYSYFEIDSFNSTTIDDNFIGSSSIVVIGVVSFVVLILIIIAIHIFSKKLDELGCEGEYQQFEEPVEEIEPLPLYEERDTHPEREIDLSDYLPGNNTINTIPRDTMNIINRLNSTSGPTLLPPSSNPSSSNGRSGGSSGEGNEPMEGDPDPLIALPSTSTLPLPTPQKENMPCIPPPCYDIALTQPRITNQGMIVLPQDPSFASNLPMLTRSSSTHRHSLRRSRQRFMRFFSHYNIHHSSSPSNNYRFSSHTPSSTVSSSSTSSYESSSLQPYFRNVNAIHNDTNTNTMDDPNNDYHLNNYNNSNNNNISNNNSSHNHNNNNNNNSNNNNNNSRSRSLFRRSHHPSSSSRRERRRRLLRLRHSLDNASISSISIYPTTTIEVPEDHYNINQHAGYEVRSYHRRLSDSNQASSSSSSPPPTTLSGGPELSVSVQPLLSTTETVEDTTTPPTTMEKNGPPPSPRELEEELNEATETWMDVTQYNLSLTNQDSEIIHIDSGARGLHDRNSRTSTSPTSNTLEGINGHPLHSHYHQITINNDYLNLNNHIPTDPPNSNENHRDSIINVMPY